MSFRNRSLRDYRYEDLLPCAYTSRELALLGPRDPVEPCVLVDTSDPTDLIATSNSTFVIPIVHVSPTSCGNHRDGAELAIQVMNQRGGISIGYHKDHNIYFTLTTIIAGNSAALTTDEYNRRHVQLLRSVLKSKGIKDHSSINSGTNSGTNNSSIAENAAPYIVGTCSWTAAIEKQVALETQSILMSQVGPLSFYYTNENHPNANTNTLFNMDKARQSEVELESQSQLKQEGKIEYPSNPFVFGFHLDSDMYPIPSVQELGFLRKKSMPIRIVYRSQSEFFKSTCESALRKLEDDGFNNIKVIQYDPTRDENVDGVANEFDIDFLQNLADEACAISETNHLYRNDFLSQSSQISMEQQQQEEEHPAIFLCTLTEHDTIIKRWLDTGCRPQSLWVTAATWEWADEHPSVRPFLQGGGQWHEYLDYSDFYFENGKHLLDRHQDLFGYRGNYDTIVSYAIPILFAMHLKAAYGVTDFPNPVADFANAEGREQLRRAMMMLNVETIFGPVVFNEFQRNVGRGTAGTQWLVDPTAATFKDNTIKPTINRLVAPFLKAEASTIVPADNSRSCEAGSFFNMSIWAERQSILASGCNLCPVNTYTKLPSMATQCDVCPKESITDDLSGSDHCYVYNDNLLSGGTLAFGYIATILSWMLAIFILRWLRKHKNDQVVKISQIEFLTLICIGAMISSSSLVALSLQAGTGEDTSVATIGCMTAPFLYTIGWVLQFSSLSAKTYRLYQTMRSAKLLQRTKVTAFQMIPIVVFCLLIDLTLVTLWTIHSPLTYERIEEGRKIDELTGVVTINSVGRCLSSEGNFWTYAGPLVGFHFFLVVFTNILLYQVRDIADRFQEQKYVAMACALIFEVLIVGIPVLISVKDSASTTYVVLASIVALGDIAVLLCIFIPKMLYQRDKSKYSLGESVMQNSKRVDSKSSEEKRLKEHSEENLKTRERPEFNDTSSIDSDADSFLFRLGKSANKNHDKLLGSCSRVSFENMHIMHAVDSHIMEETSEDLRFEDSSASFSQAKSSSLLGKQSENITDEMDTATSTSENDMLPCVIEGREMISPKKCEEGNEVSALPKNCFDQQQLSAKEAIEEEEQ